ncbi:MAG: ABC transporter substrate-binding protein [Planctomycetota bacterium]
MENRFGFKDFVLIVLLVAILASIWIAMKQFDRQHSQMAELVEQVKQITSAQARTERSVGQLQGLIEQGVKVSGTAATGSETPETSDPFARLKDAQVQPDYAEGDWVVDAFAAQVAKITPYISGDAYGNAIIDRVVETLANRDPDTLEWSPLLAESWQTDANLEAWQAYVDERRAMPLTREEIQQEILYEALETETEREDYIAKRLQEGRLLESIIREDDCPIALTITFKMRRGLTFSDGEPLTAHDVEFTFDFINNPKIEAPRARNGMAGIVKDIVATDDHTVVVTFAQPYFEAFGRVASLAILPKHFYSQFPPEEINKQPGLLLGSGPYRMNSPTQWVPGQPLSLVRNERYWGPTPTFDRVVYREITDDVARLTAFRNGEIDMFPSQPEQYVKLLEDEDLLKETQRFEYERPVGGYGFMAWNQLKGGTTPTRFADRRVRQAMTMLVPRQEIWDNELRGYGFGVTGPFNRLSPQYNQDLEPWPYDPERAKALLKEAGYEDRDGDGVIEDANGQPFTFKYTFPSSQGSNGFWNRVVLLIRDSFAQAGIVVELDPLEWSVFSEKLKGRDFDLISLAWSAGIESDIHQMFHSDNIGEGADNFMSYSNPELDALIEEARMTIDETERMRLWNRVHAILHEDQPYTFLYSRMSLIFVDDRFENVERVKIGLNDRTEWYVPGAIQKY